MEDVPNPKEVISREKETQLTEVIDALQNIAGSSYWKVKRRVDSLRRRTQQRYSDYKEKFAGEKNLT